MKTAAPLAAALLLLISHASSFAAERERPADCDAAERNEPTLDAKRLPSARFRMVVDPAGWARDPSGQEVRLTLRHGEETAELGSGVKLRIVQGGCETYSNVYEFMLPVTQDSGANGALWLQKASALLKQLAPYSVDTLVPLNRLADKLTRLAKDPAKARQAMSEAGLEEPFENGDLPPTFIVTVDRSGGRRLLRVVYSIPL